MNRERLLAYDTPAGLKNSLWEGTAWDLIGDSVLLGCVFWRRLAGNCEHPGKMYL